MYLLGNKGFITTERTFLKNANKHPVCIVGTGARVLGDTIGEEPPEELSWEDPYPLVCRDDESHNWMCTLQRLSEEPIYFKITCSEFVETLVWSPTGMLRIDTQIKEKREIVDFNPLKNRIIKVGDPTEIHIDKLTFQD